MKAINDVLGRKSEVISHMERSLEQTIASDYEEQIADIDARMPEKQLKKEDLIDFLSRQTVELDEFDDPLVRRLIDQVIVQYH